MQEESKEGRQLFVTTPWLHHIDVVQDESGEKGRQNTRIGVAFARLAPSLVKEVNKQETSRPGRSRGWEGPRRPE